MQTSRVITIWSESSERSLPNVAQAFSLWVFRATTHPSWRGLQPAERRLISALRPNTAKPFQNNEHSAALPQPECRGGAGRPRPLRSPTTGSPSFPNNHRSAQTKI